jgi:type II secretion system protein H
MPISMSATSERRRRGFTLLEVLVTLAVVGVAAGLVVPRLGGLGGWRLEAAAGRLADALTLAREESILGGRALRVELDRVRGTWTAGRTAGRLPDGIRVRDVAVGEVTLAGAVIGFTLDPAGDALPARIELADERGERAGIVLPPAGGHARVARRGVR